MTTRPQQKLFQRQQTSRALSHVQIRFGTAHHTCGAVRSIDLLYQKTARIPELVQTMYAG
jgi:hypothetical protein